MGLSKLSTTARFAILYQRGVDFLENDRFEEAQEAFSSAIMSSPQEPETWFLRAVAFDRLERYDQALFDCNRALTLRPRTHNYLWVRARLFLALGRYEESLSDADQAFKLQPGEFDHYTLDQFYSFAATAAMILVDDLRQEALEFLKRAIDCDPVKYRELASQEQDFDLLGEDPEYGTRFQELVANPQVRPEDELTPDNTADPILDTDAPAADSANTGTASPAIPDLFGDKGQKDPVPANNQPLQRIPYYAIVVLWSYGRGCDPAGVDDWCDERWYATEEEAVEALEAILIRVGDPEYGGKSPAGVGVEFRDENGYQLVKGRGFQRNCKCPVHRGVLTKEEEDALAFVDQMAIQYVQLQEKQGSKQKFGPSIIRNLKATDIYDDIFAKESKSGSSIENSHSAAIGEANKFLTPSIWG